MQQERDKEKQLCTQEIEKAERVKRILNDSIFSGAVEEMKEQIFEKWRTTQIEDTKAREHLWMMYACLEETIGRLQSIMTTGTLASETLTRIEAEQALEQSRK